MASAVSGLQPERVQVALVPLPRGQDTVPSWVSLGPLVLRADTAPKARLLLGLWLLGTTALALHALRGVLRRRGAAPVASRGTR